MPRESRSPETPDAPVGVRYLRNVERVALGGLAFAGTAIYASSFALHPRAQEFLPIATGIGLASALSWLVLGKVLLFTSGRNGRAVLAWFDTCLLAIAVGECVLMVAAATNIAHAAAPDVVPAVPGWLHLGLLVLADAAMAATFISRARWFGIPPGVAAALWIGVLNGAFALLMFALAWPLGYA